LRLPARHPVTRFATRSVVGMLAGFVVFAAALAANVVADPAEDAMAKLNELSRQAEQTSEAMYSAQLDLNQKLAVQQAADKKHTDDQAAVQATQDRLGTFQTAVNKLLPRRIWAGALTAWTRC